MFPHHIIIGASAAGIGALRTLMRIAPDDAITCITDQQERPYNTCFLADYCAGTLSQEQLFLLNDQTLLTHVRLVRGVRVVSIHPDEHRIMCSDGTVLSYTTLLLATGTSSSMPPIAGLAGTRGVFSFARLSDVHAILAYLQEYCVRTAIVIGAGLSGLEVADALAVRGVRVLIIERASQVLAGVIDAQAAACIERCAHQAGVAITCNATVTRVERDEQGVVQSVVLESGQKIATDMIICAVGNRPNVELAHTAGVALVDTAIITDVYMRTSVPNIYAAGDITLVNNLLTGKPVRTCTWPDAMAQGLIAAHGMAGKPRAYAGLVPYLSSSFFGCKFAACGQHQEEVTDTKKTVEMSQDGYRCFVENKAGVLRGFVMVGRSNADVAECKRRVMGGR